MPRPGQGLDRSPRASVAACTRPFCAAALAPRPAANWPFAC